MFQGTLLKNFTRLVNIDKYWRFTPFLWDPQEQVFKSPVSKAHLIQFRLAALALLLKSIYLVIQLVRMYMAHETGKLVLHLFFTCPSVNGVLYDIYWMRRGEDYKLVFSKLSKFCSVSAAEYKGSLGNFVLTPELGAYFVACAVPAIVIPISTMILHWEIPDMPQFLYYAIKRTGGGGGQVMEDVGHGYGIVLFLLLTMIEGFTLYKAWYNNIIFVAMWSAMTGPMAFWLDTIK